MSAPIVACELANAAGPILKAIGESLHCGFQMAWMPMPERASGGVFCVYIHEDGKSFQGIDTSPLRAVMAANSDRQTYHESLPQAPQPASDRTPASGTTLDSCASEPRAVAEGEGVA